MRKDKLYFLTFISISFIFLLIASLGIKYFIRASANQLVKVQLESSKREANEVAKLIGYQLMGAQSKQGVIKNVQKTIENTQDQATFVCVLDWSGKNVSHPDITKVGQKVNSNQSLLNSLKQESNSDSLYDLLTKGKAESEEEKDINSEIIHIAPVKDSDLIVAAHINLDTISLETNTIKSTFYVIFLIMGILITLASFFAVRMIGSYYEKQLELKNTNLESELVNLSKLNTNLVAYQQKISETNKEQSSQPASQSSSDQEMDSSKIRILTYIRNELVPIDINQIAYIHTENTITYVVGSDGKKSTTNDSLDDLMSSLDASLFFRANRQFIISIESIDKIIKYGNSQLKIVVKKEEVEIIISKNKAAEFRQWLNI